MAPSKTSSVLIEVITNPKNAVVPGVEVANLASISHGRILRSSTITKTGESKDKVTVNPSTISIKEEIDQPIDHTICFIKKLPPEILLTIVKILDPVSSACFGLTFKAVYSHHRKVHGKVSLRNWFGDRAYQEYTKDGTMLANYLKDWVASKLNYNYKERKFVTRKNFRRFIEEAREADGQQAYCDATIIYVGLSNRDYEQIQDRYMREVDKLGWEYEERPMLSPTVRQQERSQKWRKKNSG